MAKPNRAPTSEQFAAFQGMFDHFNRELFENKLPAVILNFSRKAKSYGFFAPERWDDGQVNAHEISINPNHLKQRPADDVASTLVHARTSIKPRTTSHRLLLGLFLSAWPAAMAGIDFGQCRCSAAGEGGDPAAAAGSAPWATT